MLILALFFFVFCQSGKYLTRSSNEFNQTLRQSLSFFSLVKFWTGLLTDLEERRVPDPRHEHVEQIERRGIRGGGRGRRNNLRYKPGRKYRKIKKKKNLRADGGKVFHTLAIVSIMVASIFIKMLTFSSLLEYTGDD